MLAGDRPADDRERALLLGQIWSRITAKTKCLLNRLKLVGPEAEKAAVRETETRPQEDHIMR